METGFVFFTAIVLTLAFVVLHGNNLDTQLPGHPASTMTGQTTEFPTSPGLPSSAGLRQREYK